MINWVTIPFVRILIPLLIGIGLGVWLDRPLAWGWLLFPLLFAPIAYFAWQRGNYKGRWIFGALLGIFVFGFGAWRAATYNELHHSSHYTHAATGDTLRLVGLLDEWPVEKAKSVQSVLRVKYLMVGDRYIPATGRQLIYFEKDSSSLALGSGDRIAVQTTARPIDPALNPEAFDYRRYLHFQNIHLQSYADNAHWTLLEKDQSWRPEHLLAPLRAHLLGVLRIHLTDTETFSVGSALILGYKSEIDERIRNSYADTGAMHVLAVSGLHVGLIYVIFGWLLRLVWPPRRKNKLQRAVVLAVIVWLFALLTGASPSVLRAATMFSFIAMGKSFTVKHYMFNTLALSAMIWLVIDPYLLFNVGFQLSYLAVGGIVYWQRRIYQLFVFYNDVLNAAWQLTSVSIAAQILTLPVSLYYFHQFPVYFWLSGLVVIPAATVILSLGLALFAFSWVPYLGALLGKLLFWVISLVNALIFFIQALPGSVVRGIWISGLIVILLYGFIYLLVYTAWSRQGRWVVACCAGLLVFTTASSFVTLRTDRQRRAVVYQLRKSTLLDIIDGKQVYSFRTEDADSKAISFAAQNNRWKRRAGLHSERTFSDTTAMETGAFLRTANVWQLGDQRLARIGKQTRTRANQRLSVDYLWICAGSPRSLEAVLRGYSAGLILLDGSLPHYVRRDWRTQLDAAGLPYYDIAVDGAFQFDF